MKLFCEIEIKKMKNHAFFPYRLTLKKRDTHKNKRKFKKVIVKISQN